MRALGMMLLSVAAVFAQNPGMTGNQVRDRGQTRPADQSQSWTRGRLGTQEPLPKGIENYSGILVDGTCRDRSALNLYSQPTQPALAVTPTPQMTSPNSASGITVDTKTLDSERSDILAHQVPDLLMRQPDASCAITGGTREFALLTTQGRLLNLDEGGATYAWQLLNSLPEGRAVLNGTGRGVKPQVTLRGRVQGDRLIVERVVKP